MIIVFECVKNIVRKGENAGFFQGHLNLGLCCKELNTSLYGIISVASSAPIHAYLECL